MSDFNPLDLLDDLPAYLRWQQQIGGDEAHRQLMEAARKHLDRYGPLSVLEIAEKLADLTARMEEFVVGVENGDEPWSWDD